MSGLAILAATPAATPHLSARGVAIAIGVVLALILLAKRKKRPAPPPPPPDNSSGVGAAFLTAALVLVASCIAYAIDRGHAAAVKAAPPPVVHVTVPAPVTHVVNTHPALQGGTLVAVYIIAAIVILGVVAIVRRGS